MAQELDLYRNVLQLMREPDAIEHEEADEQDIHSDIGTELTFDQRNIQNVYELDEAMIKWTQLNKFGRQMLQHGMATCMLVCQDGIFVGGVRGRVQQYDFNQSLVAKFGTSDG